MQRSDTPRRAERGRPSLATTPDVARADQSEKSSIPVDEKPGGLRGDLRVLLVGSLDHHPLLELHTGSEEGDQLRGVDRPPTGPIRL